MHGRRLRCSSCGFGFAEVGAFCGFRANDCLDGCSVGLRLLCACFAGWLARRFGWVCFSCLLASMHTTERLRRMGTGIVSVEEIGCSRAT